MKKTKILLGALSMTAIAPVMPMMLTSCGDNSTKYTVALYANDGTFADNKLTLFLNNVKKDTKLKDVAGYVEPTSNNLKFAFWRDANGNKYDGETKITDNVVLGAYYKEEAKTPTNFKTDNWATVAIACESAVKFANAYLGYQGSDEEEAKNVIKAQIRTDAPLTKEQKAAKVLTKDMKLMSGTFATDVSVRLIDVGVDKASDGSSKTLFTFEFADIIDIAMYNYTGNNIWYQTNEQGEVLESCILRENCNKSLIQTLPVSVQETIKTVDKITTNNTSIGAITSKELLFPLSYQECGLGYKGQTSAPYVIQDFDETEPDVLKTYTHYKALKGKLRTTYSTKYYYGYDGTKTYGEGESAWTPIIQYPMWLRSPNTSDYATIFQYNPDNVKIDCSYSNIGLGIAPGFCL